MAAAPGLKPMYQDFEPSIEWKTEEECDIALVSLPGFTKDQLRVQLTTSHTLKISGERPLGNNTWSRFQKQFPVSSNCDTTKITAKFDSGTLQIRQPKIITPAEQEDKKPKLTMPTPEPPKPQNPSKEPPPPPKPSLDKQPIDKPKTAEKDKEPITRAANEKAKTAEKEKEPIARATNEKATANEKAKTTEKEKEPIARAANEKAKTEEKEKEPANRKSSISSDVTKKNIDEKSGGSGKAASEEHEKFSDAVDGGGVSGYVYSVFQKYKQVVSEQFMELKKPNHLTKFAVGVLLALAFGFYVTNSVKSYVKSKQD